jgi:hypothetical protein
MAAIRVETVSMQVHDWELLSLFNHHDLLFDKLLFGLTNYWLKVEVRQWSFNLGVFLAERVPPVIVSLPMKSLGLCPCQALAVLLGSHST